MNIFKEHVVYNKMIYFYKFTMYTVQWYVTVNEVLCVYVCKN